MSYSGKQQRNINIACTQDEYELFHQASKKAGIPFSHWAKRELNISAGRSVLGVVTTGNKMEDRVVALEEAVKKLQGYVADLVVAVDDLDSCHKTDPEPVADGEPNAPAE